MEEFKFKDKDGYPITIEAPNLCEAKKAFERLNTHSKDKK